MGNQSSSTTLRKNPLDTLKWILGLGVVIAAVLANARFGELELLYRVLGVLCAFILAAGILATTKKGAALVDLIKESRVELRKVVWPSRQDTTRTTFFVLIVVCIASVILWLLDIFLGWVISSIIG